MRPELTAASGDSPCADRSAPAASDWEAFWSRIERLPTEACDGCTDCYLRCAGELQLTHHEFASVRRFLREHGLMPLARTPSRGPLDPCRFLRSDHFCAIYPVRPVICRLFGLVEWLPCPKGHSVPCLQDGPALIQAYAEFPRATYAEWEQRLATEEGAHANY